MQPQGIDLSGLKDIHLPALPSLWPLPVSFWGVVFGIVLLIFVIRWGWIKAHRFTAKKYANREVKRLTDQFSLNDYQLSVELSLLMRRIALMKYPGRNVAALTGKAWRQFLEETSKKPVFKGDAGDMIEDVTYIPPELFTHKNVAALVAATKEWIAENT